MRGRPALSWLWLLVALQVAIPASYYLVRSEPDDERFAWRMFSAIRLKRCEVEAHEHVDGTERRVDLSRALHASWVRSLGRGRRAVISRFLATRCVQPSVRYARLERRCTSPSGEALAPESYSYDCVRTQLERTP